MVLRQLRGGPVAATLQQVTDLVGPQQDGYGSKWVRGIVKAATVVHDSRVEKATRGSDLGNVRTSASESSANEACDGPVAADDDFCLMEPVMVCEAARSDAACIIAGIEDMVEEISGSGNGSDGGSGGDDGDQTTTPPCLQRDADPTDDYDSAADLMYAAYGNHLLLGRGLCRGRAIPVGTMRHMLLFHDNRFSHDITFMFHCASTIMRHEARTCACTCDANTRTPARTATRVRTHAHTHAPFTHASMHACMHAPFTHAGQYVSQCTSEVQLRVICCIQGSRQ